MFASEVYEHEGGSRFSTARVRTVALLQVGVYAFHNSVGSTSLTKLKERPLLLPYESFA